MADEQQFYLQETEAIVVEFENKLNQEIHIINEDLQAEKEEILKEFNERQSALFKSFEKRRKTITHTKETLAQTKLNQLLHEQKTTAEEMEVTQKLQFEKALEIEKSTLKEEVLEKVKKERKILLNDEKRTTEELEVELKKILKEAALHEKALEEADLQLTAKLEEIKKEIKKQCSKKRENSCEWSEAEWIDAIEKKKELAMKEKTFINLKRKLEKQLIEEEEYNTGEEAAHLEREILIRQNRIRDLENELEFNTLPKPSPRNGLGSFRSYKRLEKVESIERFSTNFVSPEPDLAYNEFQSDEEFLATWRSNRKVYNPKLEYSSSVKQLTVHRSSASLYSAMYSALDKQNREAYELANSQSNWLKRMKIELSTVLKN